MKKIDKYKLFEYVYDTLPENEIAEIENIISKDPEALKIVNEYLFLKQNLRELPIEAPEEILEKVKNESNIFRNFVTAAGKYIVWDLKPNIAFAAFALVLGGGIFQFQSNTNPLLNQNEIIQLEQYFTAFQNGENPTQPLVNYEIVDPSSTFRGVGEETPMISEFCEERLLIKIDNSIKLKFCSEGDKWKLVEQTILTP